MDERTQGPDPLDLILALLESNPEAVESILGRERTSELRQLAARENPEPDGRGFARRALGAFVDAIKDGPGGQTLRQAAGATLLGGIDAFRNSRAGQIADYLTLDEDAGKVLLESMRARGLEPNWDQIPEPTRTLARGLYYSGPAALSLAIGRGPIDVLDPIPAMPAGAGRAIMRGVQDSGLLGRAGREMGQAFDGPMMRSGRGGGRGRGEPWDTPVPQSRINDNDYAYERMMEIEDRVDEILGPIDGEEARRILKENDPNGNYDWDEMTEEAISSDDAKEMLREQFLEDPEGWHAYLWDRWGGPTPPAGRGGGRGRGRGRGRGEPWDTPVPQSRINDNDYAYKRMMEIEDRVDEILEPIDGEEARLILMENDPNGNYEWDEMTGDAISSDDAKEMLREQFLEDPKEWHAYLWDRWGGPTPPAGGSGGGGRADQILSGIRREEAREILKRQDPNGEYDFDVMTGRELTNDDAYEILREQVAEDPEGWESWLKDPRSRGVRPDITVRARELDRPPDTEVTPRTREGIRGVATAGTQRQGAIGSIRELDLPEAMEYARSGGHLIQGTDGQYVGAPRGISDEGGIQAMRERLDQLAREGAEGAEWYEVTRQGNREIAGPNRERTKLAATEQGLWSAQATPETNLGFQLQGHNAYEAGVPRPITRTGAMARKYNNARDAGGLPDLGNKTGVYQGNLDPFVEPQITGTNDIWHARGFGYTGGRSGLDVFDRGLTAQEHAFMDAETLLIADRLNAERVAQGLEPIWDGPKVQAAIWVRMKGEDLAAESGGKLDLAGGIAEARKTYPDYFQKHTVNATYERTPGQFPAGDERASLPGLFDADFRAREAFSDLVPWTDAEGRDVIYDALEMYQRPTTPMTGYFDGNTNPGRVARPLAAFRGGPGAAAKDLAAPDREMLEAAEHTRGILDGQNAAAFSQAIPTAAAGRKTSVFIPTGRPVTEAELEAIQAMAPNHYVIDQGNGVMLLDAGNTTVNKAGKTVPVNSGRTLNKELRPGGGIYEGVRGLFGEGTEAIRVGANTGYIPILENRTSATGKSMKVIPGRGRATREWLGRMDRLGRGDAPNVPGRIEAAPIRHRAGLLAERDDALSGIYGPVREDIQNFRRYFAEGGIEGVRRALSAGVPLPVIAGLIGGGLLGAGAIGSANREGS